jgi:hypothetical protein
VDYCRLAEKCFFMAAVTKDPEAAAELVKSGDDYLRRAAEWLVDQLKNGQAGRHGTNRHLQTFLRVP